jgi:hypothetical protein
MFLAIGVLVFAPALGEPIENRDLIDFDMSTEAGGVYLTLNRLYVHAGGRGQSHERLMQTKFADSKKGISPPDAPDSRLLCLVTEGETDTEEWEVYTVEASEKEYYYQRDRDVTQWDVPCRIEKKRLVSPETAADYTDYTDWWAGDGPLRLFSFKGDYDHLSGVSRLRKQGSKKSDASDEFVKVSVVRLLLVSPP